MDYSNKKTARIAGILYLIVVLTGMFSLAYVPKTLINWEDPAFTFNKIVASEFLFKLGIYSSIICYTAFVFLPIVLHQLLKQVNEFYAKMMAILALISVPISFLNLQHKFAILTLISKSDFLKIYSLEQLQSQVMLHLNEYEHGISLVSVFWGLWLLPFGYLVYKSGFIPKILGILLMLGCFGYLINFTGNLLIKNYLELGIATLVRLPASLGEIGTCLWLVIIGTKNKLTT
ncbi:MAG: DUF4386 domain-containing protein [Saprospiraceae bacterium]|jgi:hypothetical protein|uniref:DUF4386 domain-containing protein n=1 Tax=Candidatus Brachybacter algidus TaxID=2982024 RepID=UPI001B676E21|nr:DUF4386 domain-containing protein [Candidatus Brachybacter algidus]MBP6585847.1 DUF4386 domain-containing protein [Flavobacterium sp.]MBP7541072.1 DUF4386 domain-containing protein [Saprospiraceae bacterium]MBP9705403.1 DUF4386 domain-containing protein [Chitinophagales bacterium]MBK7604251.1 DUF4386 domain-containing protein [Candidatus Brachybacter algidus]MBK8355582.1 DUF4386 domain-containing protein [Candidatus Brachybacter algidus]